MPHRSVISFDQLEVQARPRPSRTPTRDKASKFRERVTNARFLSGLGVTAITRVDQMTIAMTAEMRRIVVHMDGSFHFQSRNVPIEEILAMERSAKAIFEVAGSLLGVKKLDFSVELHHFFEDDQRIGRIAKMLSKTRSKLAFDEIREFNPHYILLGVGADLEIGFGTNGHLDIYYEPEAITVGDMKEKYLLGHVQQGLTLALKELR